MRKLNSISFHVYKKKKKNVEASSPAEKLVLAKDWFSVNIIHFTRPQETFVFSYSGGAHNLSS